jgi:hypothetical protein
VVDDDPLLHPASVSVIASAASPVAARNPDFFDNRSNVSLLFARTIGSNVYGCASAITRR